MVSVEVTEPRNCVKSRGGRPGLPVPNTVICLMVSVDVTELGSRVKAEVAVFRLSAET